MDDELTKDLFAKAGDGCCVDDGSCHAFGGVRMGAADVEIVELSAGRA